MQALNTGLLARDYYALIEQASNQMHTPRVEPHDRQLVIRHISGHQVVALVEIVSSSNKDGGGNVRELAEKVVRSLESGVHVLLLDLFPPTSNDPRGMHGAIWSYFHMTPYEPPGDRPLALVSYAWDGGKPEAYLEPVAVGQTLSDMPLFLTAERYVNVPLEATYQAAYRGMPEYWRGIIEQPPGTDCESTLG